MKNGNTITLKLFRFDPGTDITPTYQNYEVPYEKHSTLLDLLEYINEYEEPFSFQRDCKIFKCGSCAVNVNGRPFLACKENVENLKAFSSLVVEPLTCFPIIKDLLVDFTYDMHERSKIRAFPEGRNNGMIQDMTRKERDNELLAKYSFCIRCGACMEICPALKKNKGKFIGPLYLLDVARLFFDPKDKANRLLQAISEGVEFCVGCKKCNEVCPVDLDVFKMAVGWSTEKLKEKKRRQRKEAGLPKRIEEL